MLFTCRLIKNRNMADEANETSESESVVDPAMVTLIGKVNSLHEECIKIRQSTSGQSLHYFVHNVEHASIQGMIRDACQLTAVGY